MATSEEDAKVMSEAFEKYMAEVEKNTVKPGAFGIQGQVDEAYAKNKTVFIDRRDYRRKAEGVLKTLGNLRLVGETGTGKSTFVHWISEQNKWTLFEYSLTADTSRWDLLAQYVLKADNGASKTDLRLGIISQWLESTARGIKVLFLDEFNYAEPNIMTLINSLADFRRDIWVPEMGKKLLRTNQHYLVIGMNPSEKSAYTGTFNMNIAQLRRFESLKMTYPDQDAELAIMKHFGPHLDWKKHLQPLLNFAISSRVSYMNGDISSPITTGNLIAYAELMEKEKFTLDDVKELIFSMYKDEEKKWIEVHWQQTLKAV
jgi:nitric oxide reductase NorQ protein/cobaltochelatase CobS